MPPRTPNTLGDKLEEGRLKTTFAANVGTPL